MLKLLIARRNSTKSGSLYVVLTAYLLPAFVFSFTLGLAFKFGALKMENSEDPHSMAPPAAARMLTQR